MRLHVFNIPILPEGLGRGVEEANRFLDRVEVTQVNASLVEDKIRGALWSVLVTYEPRTTHVETSEPARESAPKPAPQPSGPTITQPSLDKAGTELYEALRTWRNGEARRKDIPGYTIMTNRQLQKVAELRPKTLESLGEAAGLNAKALAEFGKAVVALVSGETPPEPPAESPEPVEATDSKETAASAEPTEEKPQADASSSGDSAEEAQVEPTTEPTEEATTEPAAEAEPAGDAEETAAEPDSADTQEASEDS